MDPYLSEWLNLAVRWFHVITGIAWIGTSFFFMWLDAVLEKPTAEDGPDLEGRSWLVHSGGFYNMEKLEQVPGPVLDRLHWFKWEAYSTWISGFFLLVIVYYLTDGIYLVDPGKLALTPLEATGIGIGVLAGSWIVYDLLWRSALARKQPQAVTALCGVLLIALIYFLTQVFSGRGAYIHAGAVMGTIMAGNVLFGIVPAQKELVAATREGRRPDPRPAASAKERSTHNNYMTLPVVFVMLSTHYPSTFGHAYNWLVLIAIFAIGAVIRHFFNQRNRGRPQLWVMPTAVAGFVVLVFLAAPPPPITGDLAEVDFEEAQSIVLRHCTSCHATQPTHESFEEPPKNVVLETPAQMKRWAPLMMVQVVQGDIMPLGNETEMTDEERAMLGAWIAGGAPVE